MDLLNDLRKKCDEILSNSYDEKYVYIRKILEDDNCFFIINIEVALDILDSLGVSNPVECYQQLISDENISNKHIKIID